MALYQQPSGNTHRQQQNFHSSHVLLHEQDFLFSSCGEKWVSLEMHDFKSVETIHMKVKVKKHKNKKICNSYKKKKEEEIGFTGIEKL